MSPLQWDPHNHSDHKHNMPKDYICIISLLICMGLSHIIMKRLTSDSLIYGNKIHEVIKMKDKDSAVN